jgi:phosphatidylglycerophosphatase A
MKFHKTAASVFGVGFAKGGGTIAAIITCIVWYAAQNRLSTPHVFLQLIVVVAITALGIWNGNRVEKDWGKDSSKVVIDEVAGMAISLIAIPVTVPYVLIALAFFRFFDILKPLYIRRLEKLPGGWGVMADDVLAGIYANVLLQIIVHENWL